MRSFFNKHFEWIALTTGLLLMAVMNPYTDSGVTWCLFERVGITFCPGEGLGHSIAFFVRGDISNALQANIMGPAAILIITGRVFYLLQRIYIHNDIKNINDHG